MTSQWRGLLIQWRHGDDDDRVTDFPLTADLVLEMCSKLNETFWRSAWLRRSNLELSEQKNIYQTNRFGGSTLRNFTFANSMELNGPLTNFFLKNGPTHGLKMTCPSSIRRRDSNPRPFFRLFSVFSNKHCYHFYNKSMWKRHVHPVYGAGIKTHHLRNMSLLP